MNTIEIVGASLPYAAVGAAAGRLAAGHIAWRFAEKYNQEEPDGSDWFIATIAGLIVVVIWPLVLAMRAFPAQRWAIGAEARAIARARERRIRELEEKLDL